MKNSIPDHIIIKTNVKEKKIKTDKKKHELRSKDKNGSRYHVRNNASKKITDQYL